MQQKQIGGLTLCIRIAIFFNNIAFLPVLSAPHVQNVFSLISKEDGEMKKAFLGVVVFFAVVAGMAVSASAEIKFGVLPRLSAVEMHAMFSPLADYLSKEVGEKVTLVVPKDFDAYKAMVKDGQID